MEQQNMPTGGMMPNMNAMQRAQPANERQQVYAIIMKQLTEGKAALGQGWQSTFDIGQRAGMTMQVVSALRLLGNGWKQCLEVALLFESRTIMSTQSKEEYLQHMQAKLGDIRQKRQEGIQNGQVSIPMPNGAPNNPMAGMNLPNNAMGIPNGQMSMNGNPQNPAMLAHLQRQMQPASLQQPQQGNIDPSALQNAGLSNQMPNMNASNMQQINGGADSRMQLQQVDAQELSKVAQQLKNQMPEEQQNSIRQSLLSRMSEPERQTFAARGQDPLTRVLLSRARDMIARRRQQQQQQQQQQQGGGLPMNEANAQTSGLQAGAVNIDFSGILGQQANALKLQESGEQVVPASNNNNFNMGGLPQNVNPQMLGNQNGNSQQEQMQRMLLQQQTQQRMQQQNILAQRQALQQQQQQQQLRGQPGGLNAPNALNGGPAGQLNSPAMSMLNRPMVPPGQIGPDTPQQNRTQQTPQTPANPATQLMQHHQQLMSQNGAGVQQPNQGPQVMNQQRLDNIKRFMAQPEINSRMRSLSEAQRGEFMRALTAGQNPKQAMDAVVRLGQQSGLPPNMNLSAVPPNQLSGLNGVPPPMTSAVPQFNPQPPPNQQLTQQQFDPLQMQRLQKSQEFRLQAMNLRPYPPMILPQLGIKELVPDNLKTWGSLKHHLGLNRNSLPPNTLEKVQHLQEQWFQAHPDEVTEGSKMLRASMQQRLNAQQAQQANRQQSGPNVNALPNMQMPTGQAPQAQMVPPTAPMQSVEQGQANPGQIQMNQAQMNRAGPNIPIPTAADLADIRQRNPTTANLSDDQIRNALMQKRREAQARMLTQQQQQQQQEALRNAQLQRAQQQNQNSTTQQGPRGQQQPPRPQQPTQATPMPGQKRPQQQGNDNDDLMEIPNPNAPTAKQAPMPHIANAKANQAQQKKTQSQTAGMSQMQIEQYNNMTPEQQRNVMQEIKNRQQAEALKRAQMGLATPAQSGPAGAPQQQQSNSQASAPNNNINMLQQKLRNMMAEVARTNPKGPAVQVDAQTLGEAQQVLRRLWMPVAKMETTYVVAAQLPGFEKKLMGVMRARLLVNQNAKDASGAIKDYLSLSLHDLKELELMLQSYFRELKATKDRMDEQKAQVEARQAQQSQPGLQRQPSFTGKQGQQQANAMSQSASQQGHTRKASSNAKAPPAPTENKTFEWPGSAPSPHGVPKYDGRSELTPDKLKFPPSKKRRTGQPDSQESTPAGQAGTPSGMMASPGIGGKSSQTPEQMRKSQPLPVKNEQESEPRSKGWRCKDMLCEANSKGFETEELLRKHEEDEHSPVKDPLDFMLKNAASALGVDQDGVPLAVRTKTENKPAGKPLAGINMKRDISNTPKIKQEVGTPQAGGSGVKTQGKAPEAAALAQEKTLRDVIHERMGYEPPPPPPQQLPPSTAEQTDFPEDDNFISQFLTSSLAADQTTSGIEDWTDLTLTDFNPDDYESVDWGIRLPEFDQSPSSPELTPSSSEHSSKEPELSDLERLRINFEYDYWGTGVKGPVPERLLALTAGLEIGKKDGDGDEKMEEVAAGAEAGVEGEGDGGERKERGWPDDLDWSGDLQDEGNDWEILFGNQ